MQTSGRETVEGILLQFGERGCEAVIKFAHARTKRTGIVHAKGAFHGLTCGALSLMGSDFWREGFGPMLAGTFEVPFNDISAMAQVLSGQKIAAVVLEPLQGEAGIVTAEPGYLAAVQELCRKHGALFVLDDRKMHKEFLESSRYPTITFRPIHLANNIDLSKKQSFLVDGIFNLHGQDHPLQLNIAARPSASSVIFTTHFEVPYVQWGIKDPSTFVLRVNKYVSIDIESVAHIHASGGE